MKKLYFTVNLVAGKAVINKKLGKIIDEFVKEGYEVTVHTTQSGDDAVKQAVYACENGYDLLAVAGGDGTLSQCLQGVMGCEKKIPIGYVPAGSTNDFAKSLGIPSDQIKAARGITRGKPVLCDVGGFNGSYFSYVAAFGAFTNITYETSQKVKNIFGHAAYIAGGAAHLGSIRAKSMRIEYADKTIEGEFVYGMAYNYADNTMYALCNENNPYIASVNLENGELTRVLTVDLDSNNFGMCLGLQTFAIDDNGDFYALTFSATSARLVRIDKQNGSLTALLNTGYDTFYAQSMTYDPVTNRIYWAHADNNSTYNNGIFYIDMSNYTLTNLGNFDVDLEITCLYVVNDDIEPADLLGDVDCDGYVTMADVTLLSMYLNGEDPEITAQGMLNANANEDEGVDIRDIAAIYSIISNS